MNPNSPKQMTAEDAREWMNAHWDADEIGTDLDCDILDEAFETAFNRRPGDEEDEFAALKNHFRNH